MFPAEVLSRGSLKIIDVVTLQNCGPYALSKHWEKTRSEIHNAVKRCEWPIGTGSFTIHPQMGKKAGEGNWVVPIKNEFIRQLTGGGWKIEGRAKVALGHTLGR